MDELPVSCIGCCAVVGMNHSMICPINPAGTPSTADEMRSDNAMYSPTHPDEWSDKPDQWQDAIDNAHPTKTGKHKTYEKALEMVSNRHSKGALVDLVNWLLAYRRPIEAGEIERDPTATAGDVAKPVSLAIAVVAMQEARRMGGHIDLFDAAKACAEVWGLPYVD